jgi:hypothetical protein
MEAGGSCGGVGFGAWGVGVSGVGVRGSGLGVGGWGLGRREEGVVGMKRQELCKSRR